MATKYLELNSNYRNRNQYPNPASFSVPISQTGLNNQYNAVDPVSDAYPICVFRMADENLTTNTDNLSALGNGPSIAIFNNPLSTSSVSKFMVRMIARPIKYFKNYFVGASIYPNDPNDPNTITASRIIEWIYISTIVATGNINIDIYSIAVDSPVPPWVVNNMIRVNIGPLSIRPAGSPSQLFIPGAPNIINLYQGYYILNQTVNRNPQFTRIVNFDKETHLAKLVDDISAWSINDILILRKTLPNIYNGNYSIQL